MAELWFHPEFWFHPKIECAVTGAFSANVSGVPLQLLRRIQAAYRLATKNFSSNPDSMWKSIHQKSQHIHEALMGGDESYLEDLLNNPSQTDLFYGTDSLFRERYEQMKQWSAETFAEYSRYLCNGLVRLAEATGAVPLWNPEGCGVQYSGYPVGERTGSVDIESILTLIDKKIGATIEFPNPFVGEFGVQTSKGIASYRAAPAIYQAWRLRLLSRSYGTRVLEIGGGLGRTAYYAHRFGLTDYTIVDLPLTGVAQALFLGQTLGPELISLVGEKYHAGQVRLAPPAWFLTGNERFDVVLNVDSMTEMAHADALAYAEAIVRRSKILVSINHEVHAYSVQQLAPLAQLAIMRFSYWMRKGYAEEIFVIGKPKRSRWSFA